MTEHRIGHQSTHQRVLIMNEQLKMSSKGRKGWEPIDGHIEWTDEEKNDAGQDHGEG